MCITVPLVKFASGRLDLLEPIIPASAVMASLFGVRPLMMIISGESDYYFGILISESLVVAQLTCTIGVASYLFGYLLSKRSPRIKPPASVPGYISRKRLRIVCVAYAGISVILTMLYLGRNPLGTLAILMLGRTETLEGIVSVHTEYLFVAPLLLSCCATLLIINRKQEKYSLGMLVLLFLLVAIPVAYFYLFGTRRFIIPVISVPLLSYFLVRKIRPNLKTLPLVVLAFFILSAIPFMRTSGARSQIGGFTDQITYAFTRDEILKNIFLGPDTEMLPAFAVEVQVLQNPGDFYYGRAVLGDILLAPFPSAIFDKPRSARNDMLTRAFGAPCEAVSGGMCPDFSVIGTFYQDFWIPGVVMGMMLCGWFSRRLWLGYRVQPDNPYRICTAAVVFVFTFVIIRAGFMPAFQWALYFFIPITLGLYMARRRGTARTTRNHPRTMPRML